MKKVLLVGGDAREHAMAEALANSKPRPDIFAYMKNVRNPGIAELAGQIMIGNNYSEVSEFARKYQVDLAIIGPEEPLYHGVADVLKDDCIPTVGPWRNQAQIETSKAFNRKLMQKYGIRYYPKFAIFKTMEGIETYLNENQPVVLKPDGLTGGKGVMVQGEHFETMAEALKICKEILEEHRAVVIEEKLEGEEFTLQCWCAGIDVVPMPPVCDHKRRFIGDQGPNTGSMGSYSCADHSLPFLTPDDIEQAVDIIRKSIKALILETERSYQGIIYGGFMATARGVKLIEFNARFGDPEGINVLSLLETDFMEICQAIVNGELHELDIKFKPLATVVKYVVPENYGLPEDQHHPVDSDFIWIGDMGKAKLYYASVYNHSAVHKDNTKLHLTSSRALAVLGISPDLAEAERIADRAASNITGAVAYRPDIGTAELIAKQVRHMEELRRK